MSHYRETRENDYETMFCQTSPAARARSMTFQCTRRMIGLSRFLLMEVTMTAAGGGGDGGNGSNARDAVLEHGHYSIYS